MTGSTVKMLLANPVNYNIRLYKTMLDDLLPGWHAMSPVAVLAFLENKTNNVITPEAANKISALVCMFSTPGYWENWHTYAFTVWGYSIGLLAEGMILLDPWQVMLSAQLRDEWLPDADFSLEVKKYQAAVFNHADLHYAPKIVSYIQPYLTPIPQEDLDAIKELVTKHTISQIKEIPNSPVKTESLSIMNNLAFTRQVFVNLKRGE